LQGNINVVVGANALYCDPINASDPEGATAWHSGDIAAGESFAIQLIVPGEYRYFCKPHEMMGHVGTIVVE
jgi:plastocyanin